MKKINAFSLMEMMVVLLIISIVAAATAPMINRKMLTKASETSPWVWTGLNNDITYNLNANNSTASIGAIQPPVGSGHPRLYIETNDDNPLIHFRYRARRGTTEAKMKICNQSIALTTNPSTATINSDSVLIGIGATSNNQTSSTAIGHNAGTTGTGAVAVGSSTTAAQLSVALGHDAKANKEDGQSTALGYDSQASENSTTAVGYMSRATASFATALGRTASASGEGSISIGSARDVKDEDNDNWTPHLAAPSAAGIYSIAIGSGAGASQTRSMAIGPGAGASQTGSMAIGSGATASQTRSMAIGQDAAANKTRSMALGSGANATGVRSTALGSGAQASANNSISIGGEIITRTSGTTTTTTTTTASGAKSIALGSGAQATESGAISIGSEVTSGVESVFTTANASNSIAIGVGARASAENSISIGGGSTKGEITLHDKTTTFEKVTRATAQNAIAIGRGAGALNENSVAIGAGAKATHNNEIVLGTEDSTVYIPGNLVVGCDVLLSASAKYQVNDYRTYIAMRDRNTTGNGKVYIRAVGVRSDSAYKILTDDTVASSEQTKLFTTYASTNNAYISSDRRLKNVGKAFVGGLEQIRKLQVFNYTFKNDKSKTPRVGVIAQDLQKIFPDAVIKGEDGFLRIRMEDMFYALVNAVKQNDQRITELEKQNKELIKQNQELLKRVSALEKKIK